MSKKFKFKHKESKRTKDDIETCFEIVNQLGKTDSDLKLKYNELRSTEYSIGTINL